MTTMLRTFLILATVLAPAAASAGASGLDRHELMCRRQISKTGRGHLEMVLWARIACQNRAIKGRIEPTTDCTFGPGDTGLQRALGRADVVLEREMEEECAGVDLGELGFPGQCSDVNGPPFDIEDLEDCLAAGNDSVVTSILDYYFPTIEHHYGGHELVCLRSTPRQSFRMLRGDLRARDFCELEVAAEDLGPEVDCRADVFNWGPGTGNTRTDDHIHRAYNELLNWIPIECSNFSINDLGYQDDCPDNTGGGFGIVDLKECLFDQNRAHVQDALGYLFP